MKFLKIIMFATIFLSSFVTNISYAEAPLPEVKPTTEELVSKYAVLYKVSAERMLKTIRCESSGIDKNEQSSIRYSFSDSKRGIKKGEQEKSFGIAQIHLPDHPEVTLEEAKDHEFSVRFMAIHFANGEQNIWTCYRINYSKKHL